jgi:hypothetical protein
LDRAKALVLALLIPAAAFAHHSPSHQAAAPGTALGAIEASALGHAMRHSGWLYEAVQLAHIAGILVLVGTIATLDLRLIGLWRQRPLRRLASRLLPWTFASFALIVPSGLAMFAAYASQLIGNPLFAVKICLILAAGANAGIFHAGAFRGAESWDVGVMPPPAARAAGALSLALWLGVIGCGLSLS